MIQLQEVTIGYQKTLMKIGQLHLAPGQLYALVGLNGSGKSTLLKTLATQLPQLQGKITINGYAIEQLIQDPILRSKQIAWVSSKFDGVEHLTVLDYVSLGRTPYLDRLGRVSKVEKEQIIDQLAALNLEHLKVKLTKELSDGERQLVSLARAIVQDTPVMLLDEPASFLDFLNREKLLSVLMTWVQDAQRCVVFSSHDLELCIEHNIPLLALSKGKIEIWKDRTKKEVIAALSNEADD
ncbi:MAG: hypothetical protein RLZZ65_1635 [Bacteroidota bacterium]|jgi:iron complex transport system ATP-binding protein